MHGQDGADVTEIADKTEWGAYRTSAARQCRTMVVGFFAGDIDYSGVGPLFSRLSAEYPKTWFYSVDVSTDAAQVVADKCQVHASPCIQVWRDSSLVESVDNPTTTELEDLLQRHGARW